MAYDAKLADRIRHALAGETHVVQKRMFGGLAFLLNGHMCCGVVGSELMLRVGPDAFAAALGRPHARPMDFTGRPLTGFVYVEPAGLRSAQALARWVALGITYVKSLPPKKPAPLGRPSRARARR
jgi:TfoX/Sxy family transcriptional regulator of competence genes